MWGKQIAAVSRGSPSRSTLNPQQVFNDAARRAQNLKRDYIAMRFIAMRSLFFSIIARYSIRFTKILVAKKLTRNKRTF